MEDFIYDIRWDEDEREWRAQARRELAVSLFRRYRPNSGCANRVLDIGCGTGVLVKEMSVLGDAYGVDTSAKAVAYSRRRGLSSTAVGTADALCFTAGTFDLVASCVVAVLVTWAIYPLTNLYNRSALTELVAVYCLTIAVAALLRVVSLEGRRRQAESLATAGLFFSLAALTHPITGVLGGLIIFVLLLTMVVWVPSFRAIWWMWVTTGIACLLVLAPWLVALHLFAADLSINRVGPLGLYEFDTLLSRISLFPFDNRTLFGAPATISTPFLDAQINMALVILLGTLWWACHRQSGAPANPSVPTRVLFDRAPGRSPFGRALMTLCAIASVYFLTVSLGWFPGLVPALLEKSQFGYRLITGVNLAVLGMTLASIELLAGRRYDRERLLIGLTVALTLASVGVLIKLTHAEAIRQQAAAWRTAVERATLPATMYALGSYNVLRNLAPAEVVPGRSVHTVVFTPASGRNFGAIPAVDLRADTTMTVQTNVYAFPWNKVFVDSVDVPKTYGCVDDVCYTSFVVQPGRHRLEYRFDPGTTWTRLQAGATWLLACWALGLVVTSLLPKGK